MRALVLLLFLLPLLSPFDPSWASAEVPVFNNVEAFTDSARDAVRICTGAAHNNLIYVNGFKMMSADTRYAFDTNGNFVGTLTSSVDCTGAFPVDTNFYCKPGADSVECYTYDLESAELSNAPVDTIEAVNVSTYVTSHGSTLFFLTHSPPRLNRVTIDPDTGALSDLLETNLVTLCTNPDTLSASLDLSLYELQISPNGTFLMMSNAFTTSAAVPWLIRFQLNTDGAPIVCFFEEGESPQTDRQSNAYDKGSTNDVHYINTAATGLVVTKMYNLAPVDDVFSVGGRMPLGCANPINSSLAYMMDNDYENILGVGIQTDSVGLNGEYVATPEGFGLNIGTYSMKVTRDGTKLYIANGTHLVTYNLTGIEEEGGGGGEEGGGGGGDGGQAIVEGTGYLATSTDDSLWIGIVSMVGAFVGVAAIVLIIKALSVPSHHPHHHHHHPHPRRS